MMVMLERKEKKTEKRKGNPDAGGCVRRITLSMSISEVEKKVNS
jgi:hypothetical protein